MATIKAHVSVTHRHDGQQTPEDRVTFGFRVESLRAVNKALGNRDLDNEAISVSVVTSRLNGIPGILVRSDHKSKRHLTVTEGHKIKDGEDSDGNSKFTRAPKKFEMSLISHQFPEISNLPPFGKGWVDAELLEGQIFIPLVAREDRVPPLQMNRRTKKERLADKAKVVVAKAAEELKIARESGAYRYTVVNDDLERAVREVVEIIEREQHNP